MTDDVIHNSNVYLYRYDSNSKKYQQQGEGALGCVLIGNSRDYKILIYNAQKQTLCSSRVSSHFRCILQPKNYVNFYDENKVNWSMRFKDEIESSGFMRSLGYLIAHMGISKTLKHDILLGDGMTTANGDTIGLLITVWKNSINVMAKPMDVTQSTPYDETKEPNLRKIKLGDLSYDSHLPGIHEGIVGMQKNGKRLIVVPMPNTSEFLWMEVTILRLKKATTTTPPTENHDQLVNRMRKLSRAGSGNRSGILAHVAPESSDVLPSYHPPQEQLSSSSLPPPTITTYSPTTTDYRPEAIVPFESNYSKTDVSQQLLQEKARLQQQQDELAAKKRELDEQRRHSQRSPPSRTYTTFSNGGTSGIINTPSTTPSASYNSYRNETSALTLTSGGLTSSTYQTDLLQRVKSSTQSIEDTVSDMNGKLDRLVYAQSTASSSQSSHHQYKSNFSHDTMQSSSLLKGVERLVEENDRMIKEITERGEQVGKLETRVEEVLGRNHQLMLENSRLNERSNSAHQKQSTYTSQLNLIEAEKKNYQTQIERLEKDMKELTDSFEQSRLSNEKQHQQQLEYEQQGKQRVEEQLQRETQSKTHLERQLMHLKQHAEEEQKGLQHEFELKLETLKAKHSTELLHANAQFEEATTRAEQFEHIQHKVVEARSVAQGLQLQLNESHEDQSSLKEENRLLKQEVDNLKNIMEQISKDKSTSQLEREKLDAEHHENLQQLSEKHAAELEQIQANSNSDLTYENEQLNEKLNLLNASRDEMQHDISLLKTQLEQATQDAKEMSEENERMKQQLGELEGKAKSAHSTETISEFSKEMMNEIYFKFQDTFEEEHDYSGKEVIISVRKILKQNTIDMLSKIENL